MTAPTEKIPFEQEKLTYEANMADLLKSHEGKFVLVHGDKIVGVFDTEQNALQFGYKNFGPVPLYIRRIIAQEQSQSAPAMTLGVLRYASA